MDSKDNGLMKLDGLYYGEGVSCKAISLAAQGNRMHLRPSRDSGVMVLYGCVFPGVPASLREN